MAEKHIHILGNSRQDEWNNAIKIYNIAIESNLQGIDHIARNEGLDEISESVQRIKDVLENMTAEFRRLVELSVDNEPFDKKKEITQDEPLVIEDLETLEEVLGTEKLDSIVTEWANHYGITEEGIAYEWHYSEDPLTAKDINEWLEATLESNRNYFKEVDWEAAAYDLADFVTNRIVEDNNWLFDVSPSYFEFYDTELNDQLKKAVAEINPEYSLELTSGEISELWPDGTRYVNLHIENYLSKRICVDVFLGDYEEIDHDLCALNYLWDMEARSNSFIEIKENFGQEYEDLLAHNSLSWLCEQRGLSRDVFLQDKIPDEAKDIYHEWIEYPGPQGQLTLVTSMSIEEWINTIAATKQGESLVIDAGSTMTIFDRNNGGGACMFEIENPITLTIPAAQVDWIAMEPSYGDRSYKYLVGEKYGYTLHDVCGMDDTIWHQGPSVSLAPAPTPTTASYKPPAKQQTQAPSVARDTAAPIPETSQTQDKNKTRSK